MNAGEVQAPGARDLREDWIPVERRFLGLDRRSILPALAVFALAVLMAGVLPAVDRAISYDDPVKAGDVIALRDGVTFVPTPGWGITEGSRLSEAPQSGILSPSGTVEDGGVALSVTPGRFSGTARELLSQLDKLDTTLKNERGLHTTGPAHDIATSSGMRGVLKRYTGTKTDGVLVAFVADDIGIRVVVTGPPGELTNAVGEDIGRMIASIRHEGGQS